MFKRLVSVFLDASYVHTVYKMSISSGNFNQWAKVTIYVVVVISKQLFWICLGRVLVLSFSFASIGIKLSVWDVLPGPVSLFLNKGKFIWGGGGGGGAEDLETLAAPPR